jgi:hypothetical protein
MSLVEAFRRGLKENGFVDNLLSLADEVIE